jgi:hypothetical protein
MNVCILGCDQYYCLCKCDWKGIPDQLSEAACDLRLLSIVEVRSCHSHHLASWNQRKQCCHYVLGLAAERAISVSNACSPRRSGSYGIGIDYVPCHWARWAYDHFFARD